MRKKKDAEGEKKGEGWEPKIHPNNRKIIPEKTKGEEEKKECQKKSIVLNEIRAHIRTGRNQRKSVAVESSRRRKTSKITKKRRIFQN